MNIALGAVVIFILLLPPVAFYVSYSYGRNAKAGSQFTLLDSLLASAVFSLFIHAVAVWLIRKEVRFDLLLKLVGGELKDVETKFTNAEFRRGLLQFAFYNACILVVAVVLGRTLRFFVGRWRLDYDYEILRQHNQWWYLFSGYSLPQIGMDKQDFDLLFADAAVDTHDGTIIYSGYLIGYECKGEELDRIYLNDAIRREFKKKQVDDTGKEVLVNAPGEPVAIPGNFFSLLTRI